MMVSVLMITYGHEQFLAKAIEGVVSQQVNFPFELIIANDNSPDNSKKIIDEYAKKYSFIKAIHNPANLGAQRNYAAAYHQCSGKYIAVCEGDDYWLDEHKLQKQFDFLEANEGYVLAYHDSVLVDEHDHLIGDSKLGAKRKKDHSGIELKKGVLMPTASVMYRRVIKEFPESFTEVMNGDTFLWALLGQYGDAKFMDNIKPAAYRQHSGGMWSNEKHFAKRLNTIKTWSALKEYFADDNECSAYYGKKISAKKRQLTLYAVKRLKFNYLPEILSA